MSKIAIMSSGGDCAGMNPAIKKFVDYSISLNLEPYLIYEGLEGLIDDKIQKATYSDVSGIVHRGGTIIQTSRSKRFFEKEYRQIAYNNLKQKGIDKIVVLGGDGSFRAFNVFCAEFGDIKFCGVPSTIDNDIFGTDYCLGVDTALNIISNATDSLRDTASSSKRAFVVETMGRDCGYLALITSLISGAEVCIIPEKPIDLEAKKQKLLSEMQNGRKYIIAIVSEGAKQTTQIVNWLKNDIGIETRVTILGHIQRGGTPSVFDRLMAFEFTKYAIDHLLNVQEQASVVVYKESKFDFVSVEYVNTQKYKIKQDLLDLVE